MLKTYDYVIDILRRVQIKKKKQSIIKRTKHPASSSHLRSVVTLLALILE